MARLPLIDPDSALEPAAGILRQIASERGRAFNVYRMLAHSPGTLERLYQLTSYLWNDSYLDPSLQELVILRVAQLTGSDYEWARHRAVAQRVGLPAAKIEALAGWRKAGAGRFDQIERAALALTEEVTVQVEATAATVAAVRALIGDQGTLELVVLIALYGMVSRVLRSLAVDPEPEDGECVDDANAVL